MATLAILDTTIAITTYLVIVSIRPETSCIKFVLKFCVFWCILSPF